MSQFYVNSGSSPPPPTNILELTPDKGASIPPNGSGIIFLTGAQTGTNQSVPDSNFETYNAGTNTMQFAFRYQGNASTTGATTATLITFPLTVASCVNVSCQIAGIQATPTAVGGEISGTVFKAGAGTGVLLGVPNKVVRASASLSDATFDIVVDGTGNNLLIQVTGVTGKTIEWYGIMWFVQKTFI